MTTFPVVCGGGTPSFRSSPVGAVVAQLFYTEKVIGSNPILGIPQEGSFLLDFIMAHRLMSDRDHLVALTTAADLLLRHGSNCPQQDLLALQARLVAAVERAKEDLQPRG